jgi:hypothetical protein
LKNNGLLVQALAASAARDTLRPQVGCLNVQEQLQSLAISNAWTLRAVASQAWHGLCSE